MAIDETNRMTAAAYRMVDHTRQSDAAQLFENQAQQIAKFDDDHSLTTGKHSAIDMSRMQGYAVTTNGAVNLNALAVDGYTYDDIADSALDATTVASFGFYRQTAGEGTTIEMPMMNRLITNYKIRFVRCYRKVESGNATGAARTVQCEVLPFSPESGASVVASITNLYRNDAAGAALTKNHYNQAMVSFGEWWDTFRMRHNTAVGNLSVIGPGDIGTQYVFSAPGEVSAGAGLSVSLCPHLGRYICAMGAISTELPLGGGHAEFVTRPAFDDANCYVQIELVTTPGSVSAYFLYAQAVDMADSADLSVTAPDASHSIAVGDSTSAADWDRLMDNAEALQSLYAAEHNALTGTHSYHLQRFTGAALVFDGAVVASSTIGVATQTVIEALPASDKVYFPPGAVGAAGSGICEFSIGFDDAYVYIICRRITAGTTNNFTAKVIRCDEV